jgi:hypothetical protein
LARVVACPSYRFAGVRRGPDQQLGSGIRAFKDGLSGDEKAKTSKDTEPSDKTDD